MPDINQLTEALSGQMATLVQSQLLRIAAVYENCQEDDGDWSWDSNSIVEEVHTILEELGVIARCPVCQYDFACASPGAISADSCPQWDRHACSGGCGESNDECTCSCCDACGCYDCECPRCGMCEERTSDCQCEDEVKLWPVDATS
jgi:hypothetical protein